MSITPVATKHPSFSPIELPKPDKLPKFEPIDPSALRRLREQDVFQKAMLARVPLDVPVPPPSEHEYDSDGDFMKPLASDVWAELEAAIIIDQKDKKKQIALGFEKYIRFGARALDLDAFRELIRTMSGEEVLSLPYELLKIRVARNVLMNSDSMSALDDAMKNSRLEFAGAVRVLSRDVASGALNLGLSSGQTAELLGIFKRAFSELSGEMIRNIRAEIKKALQVDNPRAELEKMISLSELS